MKGSNSPGVLPLEPFPIQWLCRRVSYDSCARTFGLDARFFQALDIAMNVTRSHGPRARPCISNNELCPIRTGRKFGIVLFYWRDQLKIRTVIKANQRHLRDAIAMRSAKVRRESDAGERCA